MSDPELSQFRAALGEDAARRDRDGRLRLTPMTTDGVATACGLAYDAGWRIAIEGAGTWQPEPAPAEILLSLRGLDQSPQVRAADLVMIAHAGTPIDEIRRESLEHGTWLALDPPGRPDRTLGSVLATATSGPLRHGFGPIRDHVLGLTVVTGDGRVVRSGGTTVKNVAGFDLAKLHVGGFGGFGIITECNLRVRALPRADATWVAVGDRDRLTSAGRDISAMQLDAVAVELLSPALAADRDWVLAVRLMGSGEAVSSTARRLHEVDGTEWLELPADRCALLWNASARAVTTSPTTIRLGVLPESLDSTLDLLLARLGEGMVSAGAASGAIRWSGDAPGDTLRALRGQLAAREIPLTVERAPWQLRRAVGHFGAYREGVGGLVSRLRDAFDPKGILQSPLDAERGA